MEDFILELRKIKKIHDLIFIKEYRKSEMCKKLGLSKNTVSERVKNLVYIVVRKKYKRKFC